MAKKIFLSLFFAFLALGGLVYWKMPPKFTGEYARVHEALWRFSRETDPTKKYMLAAQIYVGPAAAEVTRLVKVIEQTLGKTKERIDALAQHKPAPPDAKEASLSPPAALVLTEEERAATLAAKSLIDDSKKMLADFESKLSPEDIDFITQANPDALARRTHIFRETSECTPDQYAAIRAKVGPQKLAEIGMALVGVVMAYEGKYREDYTKREAELLQKEERFREYRGLLKTLFSGVKPDLHLPFSSVPADERIAEEEADLVKFGFEKGSIKSYALDLAATWPACLGKLSFPYVDLWRQDATQTNGAALLEKLKSYLEAKQKVPADLDAVVGEENRVPKDGWYHSFLISPVEGGVRLYSLGPDGKENTADDIEIAKVSIPPPKPIRPRLPSLVVSLARKFWSGAGMAFVSEAKILPAPGGGCQLENLDPQGVFPQLGLREKDIVLRTNFGKIRTFGDCTGAFSRISRRGLLWLQVKGAEARPVLLRIQYR